MLLLFPGILTSCTQSNTSVAIGMTPNCSARYELTPCLILSFKGSILKLYPPEARKKIVYIFKDIFLNKGRYFRLNHKPRHSFVDKFMQNKRI